MKKQGTLIISCLVAAAAGVAIGMLLAPDKGENLRKNVKKTVGDFADKVGDMMRKTSKDMADVDATDETVMGNGLN